MRQAPLAFFVMGLISLLLGANEVGGLSIEIGKELMLIFISLSVISFIASLVVKPPRFFKWVTADAENTSEENEAYPTGEARELAELAEKAMKEKENKAIAQWEEDKHRIVERLMEHARIKAARGDRSLILGGYMASYGEYHFRHELIRMLESKGFRVDYSMRDYYLNKLEW